ncbi:MAG: hypothetical protein ACTS4T_00330 [Candidatus Hodgkinia cicadicola]
MNEGKLNIKKSDLRLTLVKNRFSINKTYEIHVNFITDRVINNLTIFYHKSFGFTFGFTFASNGGRFKLPMAKWLNQFPFKFRSIITWNLT